MEKILVIGSKGFIGKHLVNHLEEREKYDVWTADIVVDYVASGKYYQLGVDPTDYQNLFDQADFSFCINCSGAASVPESLEKPWRDFSLNSSNVFKQLEAIRQKQPHCKYINLSSAAVYGNPERLPIHEEDSVKPISPYGLHKGFSEQICEEYFRFFGIKTYSLRLFSVFGEGLTKQLFWDLYRKARAKSEVRLFGTGEESRDYIYVKDLVRAIESVMEKGDFHGGKINVANGKEVFIREAVSCFYSFFPRPPKVVYDGNKRSGDPSNWKADISKLQGLGYQPQFSLKDGLKNYYQWVITQEKT